LALPNREVVYVDEGEVAEPSLIGGDLIESAHCARGGGGVVRADRHRRTVSAYDFCDDVWDLDRLSALKDRQEDISVDASPDRLLEISLSLMHNISKGVNIGAGSEDDADDSLGSWAERARRASITAIQSSTLASTPPKSPSLGTL
jgi:hypothetical protein